MTSDVSAFFGGVTVLGVEVPLTAAPNNVVAAVGVTGCAPKVNPLDSATGVDGAVAGAPNVNGEGSRAEDAAGCPKVNPPLNTGFGASTAGEGVDDAAVTDAEGWAAG